MRNCVSLIFSKNRALQLDGTIRSFLLHCKDPELSEIRVLYTTTTPLHAKQYRQLKKEYRQYTFLKLTSEKNFRSDVIALLALFDYVLFLTDDNILVRDFRLSDVIESLRKHPDTIGLSLRLGKNTIYCYPLDKEQSLPEFQSAGQDILKYNWTNAEYDFGYPLEVSSSLYRVEEILPFIAQLSFKNPNTLESLMAGQSAAFRNKMPYLLCFEQSVTFCAPVNMVQTMWTNRTSNKVEYSPENLAKLFDDGLRIDISAYNNFIPNACHQEVELKMHSPSKTVREEKPTVSVIIPCYNQAQYLPEAVESVVKQRFQDFEIVIVNDGSADATKQTAESLIQQYHGYKISLINQKNQGVSAARNTGIEAAKGKYILPLDADDLIHSDILLKLVDVLDHNQEIGIAYTDTIKFGVRNECWHSSDWNPDRLRFQNIIPYCSLYRYDVWKLAGGYNTNMILGYEDWDFWVSCAHKGIRGKRIPQNLFLYRAKHLSRDTEAMKRHYELHAQIILNHYWLYDQQTIAWANNILNGPQKTTGFERNGKADLLPQKIVQTESSVKILLVVHNFPTQCLSGTELYTYNLAQEIRKRGYSVRILYPEYDTARPVGLIHEYTHEGLSVTKIYYF